MGPCPPDCIPIKALLSELTATHGSEHVYRGRYADRGVDDDRSRAVLHFKMAKIHEQLDDYEKAIKAFTNAVDLWPEFLDPIEGIISVGLSKNKWEVVQTWLKRLSESIKDQRLQKQLQQASKRLLDGIENASQG